jgi:hypothetical protein
VLTRELKREHARVEKIKRTLEWSEWKTTLDAAAKVRAIPNAPPPPPSLV